MLNIEKLRKKQKILIRAKEIEQLFFSPIGFKLINYISVFYNFKKRCYEYCE